MKLTTIALACTILVTSTAMSADFNIDNHCDVQLNGNLSFKDNELLITTDSGKKILFNANQTVYVDGKKLPLSRSEKKYAGDYYNAFQDAVPLTVNIAVDGIEIASHTLNEVFGELLGESDPLIQDIDTLFYDLRSELDQQFYNSDGAFVLSGGDLTYDGWAGNVWQNKFESRVEDLVAKSVGRIMMSIGSQLLFGSDGAAERLASLENLDTRIEQSVESRATEIEIKAKQLCNIMEIADAAENTLRYGQETLSKLDIIKINIDKK